jgi:hypothetical protein
MIIGICRRFHVLPSQVLDEPAELLQLIHLDHLANPEGEDGDG